MQIRLWKGTRQAARVVAVLGGVVALTVGPQAQVSAKARPVADLAVTLVESADPVRVGDSFRYDVTVANRGSGKALDVALEDSLPPEVRFASVSTSRGSCSGGQQVTCSLGELVPGAEAVIAINVTAAQAGSATNTATATSRSDNTRSNNSATAVTTIEETTTGGLVNVNLDVFMAFPWATPYKACAMRVPEGSGIEAVLDAAVATGCLRSWDRGERFDGVDSYGHLEPDLCIDDICDRIRVGNGYTYWEPYVGHWDAFGGAAEGDRFEFTYWEYLGCMLCK